MSEMGTETVGHLSGEQCPGIEQRRYERRSRECYARVEVINQHADQMNPMDHVSHGLTQDISGGGVRVLSFSPLPADSNVIIHIGCEDTADAVKMMGSVVWTAPAKNNNHWFAGIAFSESAQQELSRLQQRHQPTSINP